MGAEVLPSFLVIGAQKSGSTFLLRCLADHPDVYMPRRETRFFEDPEYNGGDITRLAALFQNLPPTKVIGIKRPDYLARPECAERIHRHIPDAKLIVVLRDPVQRAVSSYFYQMRQGFLPVRPLEEGIRAILKGEYEKSYPKSAEIIEYGYYYRHLSHYLKFFAPRQFLILRFGTLEENPRQAIRQTYRFLGVEDAHVPALLANRTQPAVNKGVYSLTRIRLLSMTNPIEYGYNQDRTRRYRRPPQLVTKLLTKTFAWVDGTVLKRACRDARPQLSSELRETLTEIYREDVDRLEKLLKRLITPEQSAFLTILLLELNEIVLALI